MATVPLAPKSLSDSFNRALSSALKLSPAQVLGNDTDPTGASVTVNVIANPNQETANRLAFELQAGGVIYLKYVGIPGRTYSIQTTEKLKSPVIWTTLGTKVAGPNGVFDWLDLDAPNHPQQFYRTEAPANP